MKDVVGKRGFRDMAVCFRCKREVKDNHIFCGYCGAPLKPSEDVVIDGRKDKRIRYIINRVCHFEKINIIFSVVFALLLICGVFATWQNVSAFVSKLGELPSVMGQFQAKYGYYKEGLGISYLYREAEFLFSFAYNVILSVGGILTTVFSAFFLTFNSYILYLRRKYKENYSYKKPLRFIKICFGVVKACIITAIIILGILIAIDIIKIIIL